ncbi:MAG: ZIP family metal transporter [Pirellulales bacterium]
MSSIPTLLVFYCAAVLLASLAGGLAPLMLTLTHRSMELAVSFVAGVMLGVGLLHLLPHAVMEVGPTGSIDGVMLMTLAGLLAMFLIERFFCFHHHDVPDANGAACDHDDLDHHHLAHETGSPGEPAKQPHHHDVTWSGAALGLTLHSLINGVALAASVQSESNLHGSRAWAGLGTFLVIVLHKPFDSLTLGTLMARGGWPRASRHLINGLFALSVPIGAALFYLGFQTEAIAESSLVAYALAFSAGTFLCIALSDLLPELQFHQHDRVKLTAALLVGLTVAIVAGRFESHAHSHDDSAHPAGQHGDSHVH